jgi:membrane-bound lytic murein transglycosylase D
MFNSWLTKASFTFLVLFATVPAISHQQDNTIEVSNASLAGTKAKQPPPQYITRYVQTNRELLEKMKRKGVSSFKLMDALFKRYKLPVELKYLAVVESELKRTAVSPVGAVGPWQLMPATAQLLGLKINAQCDERTHLYKSTCAAAIYLRDLHSEFGDWLLVLAAYNSGAAAVHRAIRRSGSRDFWQLQTYLPAETRMHVKKILATRYYFEQEEDSTCFNAPPVQLKNNNSIAFAYSKSANSNSAYSNSAYSKFAYPISDYSISTGIKMSGVGRQEAPGGE